MSAHGAHGQPSQNHHSITDYGCAPRIAAGSARGDRSQLLSRSRCFLWLLWFRRSCTRGVVPQGDGLRGIVSREPPSFSW